MHEASIAQDIIDVVKENLPQDYDRKKNQIKTIRIKIGEISSVVPESLEFCFNAIKKDSFLNETKLVIEKMDAYARCNNCEKEFKIDYSLFICPECGKSDNKILSGTELELIEFEVTDI